jgi:protein arginine kinase activator
MGLLLDLRKGVREMLCQHCQKKNANVHFTQIVNNNKVELYLCEQCANEKGQFGFGSPLDISGFLSGLIGLGNNDIYLAEQPEEVCCEKCGMSYEDFRKTGKMGCNNCYKIYGDRIKPILKRLHGNIEHTGKMPVKVSKILSASKEIDNLRMILTAAIQNEEYEKAAEIRDKIK